MEKFKTERNSYLNADYRTQIKQEGMRAQLEWIKRQLEYASFSEKYSLRYSLKKGEIYEIDWGINVNAEFSHRHFGVVLADSDEYNPLVTVCPLKSNHKGTNKKSDIDLGIIEMLGTGNTTIAVVNQIRTIDKLRLYLKRTIGLSDNIRNSLTKYDSENAIMRLEINKVNEIIEAYNNYLFAQKEE